jgi:hypothetical protein
MNKLSPDDVSDMMSNQVIKTGASDLADVLLHNEFIVNVKAKVSNDMHWFDGVTADDERHLGTVYEMSSIAIN